MKYKVPVVVYLLHYLRMILFEKNSTTVSLIKAIYLKYKVLVVVYLLHYLRMILFEKIASLYH